MELKSDPKGDLTCGETISYWARGLKKKRPELKTIVFKTKIGTKKEGRGPWLKKSITRLPGQLPDTESQYGKDSRKKRDDRISLENDYGRLH